MASTTARALRRRRCARRSYGPSAVTAPQRGSRRSGGGLQRCDLPPLAEPPQRLRLELTDALAGDAHDAADLLERLRIGVAVQAVAELQDLLLALRQVGDGAVQRNLGQLDLDLLGR